MREENAVAFKDRKNEEGAALIMALLISFLLLVASAGLILETTTNTYNVTDTTAEMQAYNAAESGIQAVVHVLRDNVTLPNANLIDNNPPGCATAATNPELCDANRIDYIKALDPVDSNAPGDTSGFPRLSRWMTYDGTATDRVKMTDAAYIARNGYAYKIEVNDPDNTGATVSYAAPTGRFFLSDAGFVDRITYGDMATNGFHIRFLPEASTTVDTSAGPGAGNFGTFQVTQAGTGARLEANNRFEITIQMSVPYPGIRVIRGYILANTESSPGVWTVPGILFDSQTFTLQGSRISLNTVGGAAVSTTYAPGPPPGFVSALQAAVDPGFANVVSGTISSPEPIRLLVKSTGYGPRGATKQLEAIIQKNFFDGLTPPSPLTLVGPPSTPACPTCVPAQPATNFFFDPGTSTGTEYDGQDQHTTDVVPPIGTTNEENLNGVLDDTDGAPPNPFNGTLTGSPANISSTVPPWLATPAGLDSTVKLLQSVASKAGRYFPSGVQPATLGDYDSGTGITFCDGDCDLNVSGGGIMIVTGKLTLVGNWQFKGIVIITGQGGLDRRGGGNGEIEGSMIVAPYVNSTVFPVSEPVGSAFLAPQYDLSGGGTSALRYNSNAMNDSLLGVSNFVLGVVEK